MPIRAAPGLARATESAPALLKSVSGTLESGRTQLALERLGQASSEPRRPMRAQTMAVRRGEVRRKIIEYVKQRAAVLLL